MRRAPRQASTGITQTHSSMSWRVPSSCRSRAVKRLPSDQDRKSTRLNSSHGYISYAVFCLKKKKPRHTLIRYNDEINTIPKPKPSSTPTVAASLLHQVPQPPLGTHRHTHDVAPNWSSR